MYCSTLGFQVLHCLPELDQTHVSWVSDAVQPSHPLSSPSPFSFNLSQHQGFIQWVRSSHQVLKYWSSSTSRSNEYSGLISFRIDYFDILAVQGTLNSLLQHYSLKASAWWIQALNANSSFFFFWKSVWAKWNTCASQTWPTPLAVADVRLFVWI